MQDIYKYKIALKMGMYSGEYPSPFLMLFYELI